jgi:NitT/TauT family transport system substrate-binding protein
MNGLPLSRRHLLQAGGAALLLPMSARLARAQTAVNFQLSWLPSVQFGGSYLALSKGYWTDLGLAVSLQPGGPNAPVEPPVVAGTAIAGISAADYAAPAVNNGAPFKIVAVGMQKNPFAIASLPANPVNSPADLPGKKIGMALTNKVVLDALCQLNGVDSSLVEIVPTQYDAAPLINGEVDCILCWATDLPVAMAMQGVENVVMLMADFGYSIHSQTYIATEDTLANRRADLVALLKGEAMGWADYTADPAAAAAATVAMFPDLGLDPAAQVEQANRQVPLMFSELTDANGWGWWTDEAVLANVETLALIGIKAEPGLWDRSVLEEVYG